MPASQYTAIYAVRTYGGSSYQLLLFVSSGPESGARSTVNGIPYAEKGVVRPRHGGMPVSSNVWEAAVGHGGVVGEPSCARWGLRTLQM